MCAQKSFVWTDTIGSTVWTAYVGEPTDLGCPLTSGLTLTGNSAALHCQPGYT
jgi:hypothetical protein